MIIKEKDKLAPPFLPKFKSLLSILSIVWICVLLNFKVGYVQSPSSTLFHESNELLPDFEDSYGVVFSDLNNDSWPDIYVVRFRNLNRLFINPGNGGLFQDGTIGAGLGGNLMPRGLENLELGASAIDMNNDGLLDIMIAGWGESTRLFRQQPKQQFQDITRSAGILPPLDGNGAFWADVNLDGNLDVFITDEHHPNRLLLGDGRGYFIDVSKAWGIIDSYVSQGAAFGDLDGDDFPDLYVCNWFAPDHLYKNSGKESFVKIDLPLKHLQQSLNSNGITFSDFNTDGALDFLVTDRDGKTALYRNQIQSDKNFWEFNDETIASGVVNPYPAYGSVLQDFNNDGLIDIWISNIGPNLLFLKGDSGKFIKQTLSSTTSHPEDRFYSTGAASADLDKDGDLDLFISNKDTNSVLYINQTNNRNSIQFSIIGISSNRDAIGTKIWLYSQADQSGTTHLLGYQEISGGGGYLSQNSSIVHFGLPDSNTYQAVIRFPSRKQIVVERLIPGEHYIISEDPAFLSFFIRGYQKFNRIVGEPHFWESLLLFIILITTILLYVFYSTRRYQWAVRHILFFFSLAILVLYGIFIAFQTDSIQTRLYYQLITLYGLLVLLTFFMEKIRKLEINRAHYRKLLRNFSQELILIKNTEELLEALVNTIQSSIKPEYCAIYKKSGEKLKVEHTQGNYGGPDEISLSKNLETKIIQEGFEPHIKSVLPGSYQFAIYRNQNLFGLLIVSQPYLKKDFTPEDKTVFQSLATQIAIAIENNQYIEETKILIKKITESETREKYVQELERTNLKLKKNNKKLEKLYADLKDTQAQLVQSEKMAGLGQLVAGVAHELNNPISYIYANMKELDHYISAINDLLSLLQDPPQEESEFRNSLHKIRGQYDLDFIRDDIQSLIMESVEGSQRVKEVVLNLRNFSRLDEAASKLTDLHEGLDSTLLLLNNETKNRIKIHKEYGKLPKIYCHPGNINQVFMNLLLNAIQSIEKNGNIWIKTRRIKNVVELIIRDDGKGIPKKHHHKIFDPFFTTKPIGKGTGLGLSICYQIIQEHKGKISFKSKEKEGTQFRIELPVAQSS
jgi:signal transduction histidine kinase